MGSMEGEGKARLGVFKLNWGLGHSCRGIVKDIVQCSYQKIKKTRGETTCIHSLEGEEINTGVV